MATINNAINNTCESGFTAIGGTINLATDTLGSTVNIANNASSENTINIGNGANSGYFHLINIGSATGVGSTTILAGSGGITMDCAGIGNSINLGSSGVDTIIIGGGTNNSSTNIGSNSSGTIAIDSGSGGITVNASTGGINIAGNVSYTLITTSSSTYTVLDTDYAILVDSTGGVRTVKLPNAPTYAGQVFTIKDWKGQAATHNITITTVGGSVTIDGSTSVAMNTAYESIDVIFDGSNYSII